MARNAQLRSKDSTIKDYQRIDSMWSRSDSMSRILIGSYSNKVEKKNTWIKILLGIGLAEALALAIKM